MREKKIMFFLNKLGMSPKIPSWNKKNKIKTVLFFNE
jgi:hypothetical protein